jgi:hypothetical protein
LLGFAITYVLYRTHTFRIHIKMSPHGVKHILSNRPWMRLDKAVAILEHKEV